MSSLSEYQRQCRNTIEAALMSAQQPLSYRQLRRLFHGDQDMDKDKLLSLLEGLRQEYAERGIELVELASGWQLRVRADYSDSVMKLWQGKPPRMSRAMLETLAIIAYRQPVTRGEIEEIRGVQISPGIPQHLFERGWIRVVGHREVPGRPELLATTAAFLDYFQLRRLEDLPPMAAMGDGSGDSEDLFANATEGAEDSQGAEDGATDGAQGDGQESSGGDGGAEPEEPGEHEDAEEEAGAEAEEIDYIAKN